MDSFEIGDPGHADGTSPGNQTGRSVASKQDMARAHEQMSAPSQDWTKLSNILRRSCGGSSRTRAFHNRKV